MLINTVLLFLSNSLVIFIVIALLLSIKNKYLISGNTLSIGAVIGVLMMLILWFCIDGISQMNDGTGLEWFYAIMHVFVYLLILAFVNTTNDVTSKKRDNITYKSKNSLYASAIMALVIMLQGTNFLIYFLGYWSQDNVINTLFVGIVLGAGICMSISILLYFFCFFLNERFYGRSTELIFIFFACGLINKTSDLLLQIDFLPSTRMIFDLDFIVREKSELGHFLKALLGYDASPTILQVVLYFTALFIALILCQVPRKPWRLSRFKEIKS
jgi:high-affinity iron transporter